MILVKRLNTIVIATFTILPLFISINSYAQIEMEVNLFFFKKAPFPNSHFIDGDLFIFDDKLVFKPAKLKELIKDIEIDCAEVRVIKKVFPNRLKIILDSGDEYQLHSFKRKKIIKQICRSRSF